MFLNNSFAGRLLGFWYLLRALYAISDLGILKESPILWSRRVSLHHARNHSAVPVQPYFLEV